MATLNFFDNYVMMAITEEIVPEPHFFRDRYFPTEAGDIFKADKVLTEYRKGDRKMAAFVAPRAGDIPMERRGYEIHEYQPAYIAPSRVLTLDDLQKRGFGEALYPGMTKAQRAARLQLNDLSEMDRSIRRREEWMAAQTMLENACTMQEYVDGNTKGETNHVQFYDGTSDHIYTVSNKWNAPGGDVFGDVKGMCKLLAHRGLPAADLVLGSETADAIWCDIPTLREMLDNRNINLGALDPTLTQYPGVAYMGTLNFGGFRLNLFDVSESYESDTGKDTPYFPTTGAMVTAPGCGHMMYGQITQIDHGSTEYNTYAAKRVPKFICDQAHDIRKLRLGARPLAAPKNYCPYIFAADVVG